MGCVDIAGSGPVHLIGGAASFGSAYMLGPRLGRYANGRTSMPMGNPVNACMGLFVLWWGWLAVSFIYLDIYDDLPSHLFTVQCWKYLWTIK